MKISKTARATLPIIPTKGPTSFIDRTVTSAKSCATLTNTDSLFGIRGLYTSSLRYVKLYP